jgi:DNA-binding transcriptional regulator YiaG
MRFFSGFTAKFAATGKGLTLCECKSRHTPEYQRFLARFRAARAASRLTQREVAAALEMPASRVARMETGERRIDVIELLRLTKLHRGILAYLARGV